MIAGLDDPYCKAEVLTGLGEALRAAGDHEAAQAAWRQALGLLESLDHPDAELLRPALESIGDRCGIDIPSSR